MREKYGIFIYADHDLHNFLDFSYKTSIHGLGKMLNVISFNLDYNRINKPSAKEIVQVMHEKNSISAFIPYNEKKHNLVKHRIHLSFIHKLKKKIDFLNRIKKVAPHIIQDIIDTFYFVSNKNY
ncbi:MAG: hypothetical protein NC918_00715 [Candidatus Omnitrophica bacterium]|nr:hypothetical protein [Candidatus Omnitrophota bacterium]